jgi:hypothetical protein
MSKLLYGVRAADPATFGGVALSCRLLLWRHARFQREEHPVSIPCKRRISMRILIVGAGAVDGYKWRRAEFV